MTQELAKIKCPHFCIVGSPGSFPLEHCNNCSNALMQRKNEKSFLEDSKICMYFTIEQAKSMLYVYKIDLDTRYFSAGL
jgi:hypothetical protein